LLEEYTKGIDLLTVNEENRLRKKVEELTIGTSDISILKQRVATHKKAIALTNYMAQMHRRLEWIFRKMRATNIDEEDEGGYAMTDLTDEILGCRKSCC